MVKKIVVCFGHKRQGPSAKCVGSANFEEHVAVHVMNNNVRLGKHSIQSPPRIRADSGQNTARTFGWQLWVFASVSLISIARYLDYIFRYGVNAIYWDEWNFAPLVRNSMLGHLTFSQLWAQHNEDRIFFPNLIAIVVARTTRWNDFAFYLVSAALLIVTFAIMARIFRDEIRRGPLWFIFLPLVAFTLAQYENALWAFQIAWFLVLCCIVGSIALLSPRKDLGSIRFASALGVAIIASYSSMQGLLVWPIGLVVLFAKGRPNRLRVLWGLTGVAAIIAYFIGFTNTNVGVHPLSAYVHHVGTTVQAFFIAVGNVITNQRVNIDPSGIHVAVLIGIVLTIAASTVVVAWFIEGRPGGAKSFTVALVLIGLGFDLSLIPSRLFDNIIGGTPSRYTTFNWPLVIGIYLATVIWHTEGTRSNYRAIAVRAVALALVVSQVVLGTLAGISGGQSDKTVKLTSADVLANVSSAPSFLVNPYLYPPSTSYVDEYAQFLKVNKMNVFAGDTAEHLQALGLVPGGQPPVVLPEPISIREWTRDDGDARRAWDVLSAVYSSSDGALADYPDTAAGSEGLVAWASTLEPVPADEMSMWVLPPTRVFLEQYGQYYWAWQDVLTWSGYVSLPIPNGLSHDVSSHPKEALAWSVLSGVYANSPWLQRLYPSTDGGRILQWAAMAGSLPSGGFPALVPLRGELIQLARLDRYDT